MRYIGTFLLLFCCGTVHNIADQLKLTAVNDSPNVALLYSLLNDEDLPSASDVVTDLDTRNRLCEHVIGSGYFVRRGIRPVDYDQTHSISHLRHALRFIQIFRHIYTQMVETVYPYSLGEFRFLDIFGDVNVVLENVLLCLAQMDDHFRSTRILPLYISKEYSLSYPQHKPARFVFEHQSYNTNSYQRLLLAEQPTTVHVRPDLNIELLYLRIRENRVPPNNVAQDPLCMMMLPWRGSTSQLERLCVAVLGSTYFQHRERYPRDSLISDLCEMREITFQTEEGVERSSMTTSDAGPYKEWMILCEGATTHNKYYISRTYSLNRVFVYRQNEWNGRIYLENLSVNFFIQGEGGDETRKRKRERLEDSRGDEDSPDRKTNRTR